MPDSKETGAVPSTTQTAGRTTSRPEEYLRQEKTQTPIRPGDSSIQGVLYPVDILLALAVQYPNVELSTGQNEPIVCRSPDVYLDVGSELADGTEQRN